MSRISKFEVLLLMQQLDELLENRQQDKSKDKSKHKKAKKHVSQ